MKKKSIFAVGDPVFDAFAFVDDQFLKDNDIKKGFAPHKSPKEVRKIVNRLNLASANCGGSGANIAKGFAYLGGKSALLGQYGEDEEGRKVRESLLSFGCEDKCLKKKGGITTQIYILLTPDSTRSMISIFGASQDLDCSKVNYSNIDEYDYVLFDGYQFNGTHLLENSYNCLRRAEEKGKGIILCLATNNFSISDAEIAKAYYGHVKHFANKAKIISGNEEEFLKLFNFEKIDQLLNFFEPLCTSEENSKYLAIVITLGKEGAWVLYKGQKIFVNPPDIEKPVDTTGAGDHFIAGFLYGIFHGHSLDIAVKIALITSGDIISRQGTVLSENAKAEVKSLLG